MEAYSVADFTKAYPISRSIFYEEVKAGRLRAVKLGARTMVLKKDAEAWADHLPALHDGGTSV